jgi:hypothetical protein
MRHVLARLLHGNECLVQTLTQLGPRVEVDQQARFGSGLIADGKPSERMTLNERMGVVHVRARRIHAHADEPAGSKQRCGLLEVRRDIGLVTMLEDLNRDQVIKAGRGTLECVEVTAQQTLTRQGRSSLKQSPDRLGRYVESEKIEPCVNEREVVATVAAANV